MNFPWISEEKPRIEKQEQNCTVLDDDTIEIQLVAASNAGIPLDLAVIEERVEAFNVCTGIIDDTLTADINSVDVVVFDTDRTHHREESLLAAVRDQHPECLVVILIDPDMNIDLSRSAADEFLIQPVTESELSDTIKRLLQRRTYHGLVQKHLTLASKLATLEAVKSIEELKADEQYTTLTKELVAVETQCAERVAGFNAEDFTYLFRELDK